MGRILILLGVLLLVAGVAVPLVGAFNVFGDFGTRVEDAINPTAAEYCNSGETLETTSGASTRTSTDGFGTGRVVYYFCENSAGERREVTDAVNTSILGTTGGIFGSVGSMFTSGLAAAGLSMGGVGLIVIGVLMTFRGKARVYRPGQPMTSIDLRGGNAPIGTSPFGNSPIGAPPSSSANPAQTPSNAGGMTGDVIDFVRDQLDTAYRNGQITRDDYDRAVDKLNRR